MISREFLLVGIVVFFLVLAGTAAFLRNPPRSDVHSRRLLIPMAVLLLVVFTIYSARTRDLETGPYGNHHITIVHCVISLKRAVHA